MFMASEGGFSWIVYCSAGLLKHCSGEKERVEISVLIYQRKTKQGSRNKIGNCLNFAGSSLKESNLGTSLTPDIMTCQRLEVN